MLIPILLTMAIQGETSILSNLSHSRMEIKSCEVVLKVTVLVDNSNPNQKELDEFHYYWTSDLSIYRMDRHMFGMKGRDDIDHYDNLSFDGSKMRIVYRKDNPDFPLEEISLSGVSKEYKELLDPRLFGLYLETIKVYHNFTYSDLIKIVNDSDSMESGSDKVGKYEIFHHKLTDNNNLYYKYHYDYRNLPIDVNVWNDAVPKVSIVSRLDYPGNAIDGVFLPKSIDLKRYINDKLSIHEIWDIEIVSINKQMDKEICQWPRLNPTPGARLEVDHDSSNIKYFWDGTQFQKMPIGEFDYNKYMIAQSRKKSKLYIAVFLSILSAVLIAYRILRRKSIDGK